MPKQFRSAPTLKSSLTLAAFYDCNWKRGISARRDEPAPHLVLAWFKFGYCPLKQHLASRVKNNFQAVEVDDHVLILAGADTEVVLVT